MTAIRSTAAQDSSLSEREAQLIYSRAFEAILWASPALGVMAQVEAGRRDLGAGNHKETWIIVYV